MTALVILLTVLGGALPLYAGVRAATSAHRHFNKLNSDLRQIKEIAERPGADDDPQTLAKIHEVRRPGVDAYYWVEYAPDIAERRLYEELRKPAIMVALGVLAATAGSLLSLTL